VSDREKVRAILGECRWPTVCPGGIATCRTCEQAKAVLALVAAEREACEERVRCFVEDVAHRWVLIPHNSADGKARDRMLVDVAAGRIDPVAALAAIRARKDGD